MLDTDDLDTTRNKEILSILQPVPEQAWWKSSPAPTAEFEIVIGMYKHNFVRTRLELDKAIRQEIDNIP